MKLDDLVRSVRAAGDASDDDAGTRVRIRRSLESRAVRRKRLASLASFAGIFCFGTLAWALATGRVPLPWRTAHHAPPADLSSPPPRPATPTPTPTPVAPAPVAPALVEVAPPPAPRITKRPPPAPPVAAAPEPIAMPEPAPVEALYRHAHELHFHGSEPAAALAAWDAYLAAEPTGRFALEAQYNRALVLVKLKRYRDASAALAPFARGEIGAAYRQHEAQTLVARLAQYE